MNAATHSVSLPKLGMTCASWVAHVERALRGVPGVFDVVVNLGTDWAGLGDYRTVDRLGGAVRIGRLSLIVTIPDVTDRVKRRLSGCG
jgi:copper chaperone CopZ